MIAEIFRRAFAALAERAAAGTALNITGAGLAHVIERHTVGGAQTAGKSIFASKENIVALMRNATSVAPVKQPGGNFARVIDAKRTIGIDRVTGMPTSIYTVITNEVGELITAFPAAP